MKKLPILVWIRNQMVAGKAVSTKMVHAKYPEYSYSLCSTLFSQMRAAMEYEGAPLIKYSGCRYKIDNESRNMTAADFSARLDSALMSLLKNGIRKNYKPCESEK